jgi:hypothetical protein
MVGTHGSGCQCDHDLAAPVSGTQWLDEFVDLTNVTALNEETSGSATELFRPYSQRLQDPERPCLLTTDDPELKEEGLVITVPFTCPVKLTGLTVIGGEAGRSPRQVLLFANLVDAGAVMEIPDATQTVDPLVEDFCGVVEYPLRPVKFSQVTSLTLQFPLRDDVATELFWIGLKGVASGDQRKAVVTVYESRANIADHQVKTDPFGVGKHIQ